MATMNVSLPDELRDFVDDRVRRDTYTSASEYVRELIRKDRQADRFRSQIQAGLDSPIVGEVDDAYFDRLRQSVTDATT